MPGPATARAPAGTVAPGPARPGTRRRRALGAAATATAAVLVGALLWLLLGDGTVNYDATYELVWGQQLARGEQPDTSAPLAPTPHPLGTLLGLAFSPLGDDATLAMLAVGFLALGALGALSHRLGAAWSWWPVGLLGAVLVLTREPVLSFGARAYLDLPYLALVLGALLVETRRPRAGAPALALLGVAGLIRPEAWVLAGAYVLYVGAAGPDAWRRALRLVPLAVAAPVLWLIADLAVFGDALHSARGPREDADILGRPGIGDVPEAVPRRLGEIMREPVLVGAAAGTVLALLAWRVPAWRPAGGTRGALLGLAAAAVGIGALVALVAAGLPLNTRYLLLPAILLTLVCAMAVLGWRGLAPRTTPRRTWGVLGAVVALLLVAFAPAQADRIRRLERALSDQASISADLHALARDGAFGPSSCGPISVPNSRPIPSLALWLQRAPSTVTTEPVTRGSWLAPARQEIVRRYQLDPNDLVREGDRPPAGFRRVAANDSWVVFRRCDEARIADRAPSVETGPRGPAWLLAPTERPRRA